MNNNNLANVPNKDPTHWEYIDIFLFRNGKHADPPRKYHLKYEELTNWEKTIKNIAHTQYGTKHSAVELYTINGEKITIPIEMTNNNYYVTVPAQETFIPAEYNEYILKASRSRDKRLGKIKIPFKDTLAETQTEEHINTVNENRKSTKNCIDDGTNESSENTPTNENKVKTENKTLVKTLQRPKATTNSSLLKVNNNTKANLKKTDNLLKKNFKFSPGKIGNKDSIPINFNNSFKRKSGDTSRIGFKSLLNTQKKDKPNAEIEIQMQNTATIIDENTITSADPKINDDINDNELIVVKNPDSVDIDENKSSLSRPIVVLYDIPSVHIKEENKSETKSTTNLTNTLAESTYKPNLEVYKKQTSPKTDEGNNFNLFKGIESQEMKNNYKNNNIQSKDNFIAIIEKGDMIDFSLKLALNKCNGIIRTQYSTEHNMESEGNNKFGECFNTKANVTKEERIDDGKAKIIVIQCSCCGHENLMEIFHQIETSAYCDDKKYVVLVPEPCYEQHTQRCSCDQDTTTFPYNTESIRMSIVSPLKKTENQEEPALDTTFITTTTPSDIENNSGAANQDMKPSTHSQYLNTNGHRIDNNSNQKNISVRNLNEEHIQKDCNVKNENTKSNVGSNNFNSTASLNIRKNTSNIVKPFREKSTQTEWSSLLLEAKRHEDGRYSFHIPPLSVLKCYFW